VSDQQTSDEPLLVIARTLVDVGDPRGEITAERILRGLDAAGFAVAPKEPLPEMVAAARTAVADAGGSILGITARCVYRAMLTTPTTVQAAPAARERT
jgi:hypothetical protein